MPESDLIEILEAHRLEPATELPADIVLYAVPDPWPFPPHLRVVPEIVAALDLAEAMAPSLAELGRVRLADLADGLEPSWQRRPPRRRRLSAIVPSSAQVRRPHPRLQHSAAADAA